MKKLTFSTSNLFIIMNMNFFKRFDKVLFGTWKMFDKKDYQKYSTLVSEMKDDKNQKVIPTNQSNFQQLEQFKRKYNLDNNLHNKIKDCQGSKNSCQVKEKKQEILDTMKNKKIKTEDMERIKQLVNNSTNTVFGCRQEKNTIKEFETIQNCKVIDGQKRCEYVIGNFNDEFEIVLVGKIDGVTENGEIIEIKNRINKNFNFLKDYEKPQIMTYLWMHKAKQGFLVENLKSKKKSEINVITVDYKDNYVEEYVIPNVEKYFEFFKEFMESEDLKIALLKGDEAGVYNYFVENY